VALGTFYFLRDIFDSAASAILQKLLKRHVSSAESSPSHEFSVSNELYGDRRRLRLSRRSGIFYRQ
jgi:hypothetical protein